MSNILENSSRFEITADFFNDKGFINYGMHRHDTYEVLFVKEGKLNFLCGDNIYACKGCCLIFFREKKMHTTEVDPSFTYCRYNVNFRFAAISEALSYDDVRSILEPDCFVLEVGQKSSEEFEALFRELCAINDKNGSLYDSMKKSLLCVILSKASLMALGSRKQGSFLVQTYITDVIKYIDENIDKKLVISEIAAHFFVSRAKLISDFKENTGITIGELVFAKRMKKAKSLLKKGVSVSATAEACGFSSTCHFIRTFKNSTGTTPLKYSRADTLQK